MKRRSSQERDEAIARAQADARREQLLRQLRDRETSNRQAPLPQMPDADLAEPGSEAEPAAASDSPEAAEPVAD